MAKASLPLVDALRRTARKLSQRSDYQWGHMGSCNCGFLAQEITQLNKAEIHRKALERYGDWNEQLNDYCPTSGLPLDDVISAMIAFGFDADDLKHLEKLSNPSILKTFPPEERNLKHNIKSDVVRYLNAWANLLEQQLVNSVALPELELPTKVGA